MRNITGQAVFGDDLYGREFELSRLWEHLEQGEHLLMLAPRRVGKTSLMLELHSAPRERWEVVYVDVQSGEGPADCVAAILAELAARPGYRTRFEAIPFAKSVSDVLGRLSATLDTDVLRVELKHAIGSEWGRTASQLRTRLTVPDADDRLLIIIDELPYLVARMLRAGSRTSEAELLLSTLRHWRQDPELRGRFCTLIGGSIGLEGVLRRAGISGLINDLTPFLLDSWDRSTAVDFLAALGDDCEFQLDDATVARLLDLLGDPVPYHVQLFFAALCTTCRGDIAEVSPNVIERCFSDRLTGARGTPYLDHYATRLEISLEEHEHEIALGILGRACRRERGVALEDLEDLRRSSESLFLSVLRELEADGYLKQDGDHLHFRSNLLREWWRKHHGRRLPP